MNLNSLLDIATFSPRSLRFPDAWIGHLPFAAWVIQEVSPKIFVELGTHSGNSYFSFCQAVAEFGLSTKCFAVDTWQGDEHAGRYDDEVFSQVNAYHQEHYANFSRLMRMTFNDALSYFMDESIELLHIDGLHTYEAISHDFETWLPKLAPGAVVMFHDTNVRERNFGVWKLWEELQTRYPDNLDFVHSHGLGILQLNNAPDSKKLGWLQNNSSEKQRIKAYFAALGSRQLERYELGLVKSKVDFLNQSVAERDGHLIRLNQEVAERDGHLTRLNQEVAERDGHLIRLNQEVAERDGHLTRLNQAEAHLNQVVAERDRQIAALHLSRSWRFTAPLRWLGKQAGRAKLILRAFSLANWQSGGARRTISGAVRVYRREGLQGVRARIRYLLDRNSLKSQSNSNSPQMKRGHSSRRRSKEVLPHQKSVDIIVCVHNALDDVRCCLESILSHTSLPYRLIIVDDGSGMETKEFLERFVIGQQATLIRNDSATGYTMAANAGMRASTGDFVLLLNSDTIVPPHWLDRLIQCADSDERIGMVGPLSNTASWQSVPQVADDKGDWAENPLPKGWSVNDYAKEVARVSPRIYPRVGFLNGFCLLIRRELINEIGLFDEEKFGRGYGEENDYCLRATNSIGRWQLAVADDCYVFHAQSKSYSHERRVELSRLAGETLANKHGHARIEQNLAMTRLHPALQYMRRRCESIEEHSNIRTQALRRFEGKRVLFLLPAGTSGGGSNIVLLEAATMREFGVDACIANLEINRRLFEKFHPDLDIPVFYLDKPDDLVNVAMDFDAVIATLYLTVFWMEPLKLLSPGPVLGYYVQDFEPDFFDEGSPEYLKAIASYTAIPGLRIFAKTNWNREMLNTRLGVRSVLVGPSVDMNNHYPSSILKEECNGAAKLLAMVRPNTPRRAPEATMLLLKRLTQHFGDRVDVTIFGAAPYNQDFLSYPRDFPHRYLGEINAGGVADALSDADIFIDCSTFQAMGLTAMEAMASGVAVVGPINGGLREIIEDGHNGLLVDTRDENAIFSAVSKLVTDHALRERIRANGFNVLSYSPVLSSFKILDCLFLQATSACINDDDHNWDA